MIFLDHNRRALVGTPYEDMLACIRCGACLNVCPVYRRVGGHAYDSVYPGPMGKVLTPLLSAGADGRDLPGASTLCGACTEACPVQIPLADLLVRLRADLRTPGPVVGPVVALAPDPAGGSPTANRPDRSPGARAHVRLPGEGFATAAGESRLPARAAPRRAGARQRGFDLWARLWASPAGYRGSTTAARGAAALVGGRSGWLRRAPGLRGWTDARDVPVPASARFRDRWDARTEGRERW